MPPLRTTRRSLVILALCLPLQGLRATPDSQPGEPSLEAFVSTRVTEFHQRRLERLSALQLDDVLARKNPYLLRAKNLDNSRQLVTDLLDSHLAPQEAGIFGSVMEQLALEVCRRSYGGRKSAVEGIDMEFERDGTRYIVSIKSGPNWGNSSQINKMRDYFRKAKKILGTNTAQATKVVAVNGCCYGTTPTEDRGDYLKLCGKNFWTLISGDDQLYLKLVPLFATNAGQPRGQGSAFDAEYQKAIDRFTAQFENSYCDAHGTILWDKITELSSGNRQNP